MKIGHNRYAYLVASQEERMEEWEDGNIIGYYGKIEVNLGEFNQFLTNIIDNLNLAKQHCASDMQGNMIQDYIEHFRTGSIKKHIDSQICWVKDDNPTIETNIGWTGKYLDPFGKRFVFGVYI
jgi:dipeptidyl-peptidase-3